jgi:hypothetical protein
MSQGIRTILGLALGGIEMTLNIAKEVKALRQMTVAELKERHVQLFGEEARSGNKDWLWKRIAWRIQANAYGDLSEVARARALEMANDADLRVRAPKGAFDPAGLPACAVAAPPRLARRPRGLRPDTVLTREYRGETYQVIVRETGFEFEGEVYRSLTAVAKAITGQHWNGCLFFGLKKVGG